MRTHHDVDEAALLAGDDAPQHRVVARLEHQQQVLRLGALRSRADVHQHVRHVIAGGGQRR